MMPLASATESGGTTFTAVMDHVAQGFEALGAAVLVIGVVWSIVPPSSDGLKLLAVNVASGYRSTDSTFRAVAMISRLSRSVSGLRPPVPAWTTSEPSSTRASKLAGARSAPMTSSPDHLLTSIVRS